ncbi:hypothetical protein [Nocardia shimofusensis]|uniref:hypothetical protein n=1 Tax=Nocardia shimofusensis TaxID=228596 RepID=UPI00083776A3|nr:hypothetical protein [Nocardia shimofusensis]
MRAIQGLLNFVVGIVTAVLGAVVGLLAAVVWILGGVLCATILLIPLGLPVIKLGSRLFGFARQLTRLP